MKNTAIVCGFKASGKTTAFKNYNDIYSMIDSDTTVDCIKESMFRDMYMRIIEGNLGKVDIIFAPSDYTIRKELYKKGYHFITVYPEDNLMDEYIGRFYRMGYSDFDIRNMINGWDWRMETLGEAMGDTKIRLHHNQYITLDTLDAIVKLQNAYTGDVKIESGDLSER